MNNTIMIVDDMRLNIDLLAENLKDKYVIMPATSGEMAMKLLERKRPDLLLLDVSMPGIDGFEVLRFMKERKELASIPVIFVTGEHDTVAEEKGLALGAVDYVKKPYNPAIVKVKVQNHLELKAYRDGLELLVQERTKQLAEHAVQLAASREAIIMGMSLMSEIHDKITGDHVRRIKYFTGILCEKIIERYPDMLTAEMAAQITLFSPLHDVGKVAISDAILKKEGGLTPEEFETMKSHTLEGANLLRQTELFLVSNKVGSGLNVAIEIAEFHHEKYDGTGYPHGLKNDEIPVSARIVSIVDIYDALRSPRPYKKSFTHEESVDIIVSGDGRTMPGHFDPRVLEIFRTAHNEFEKIYLDS